jgi:hypothetical protein
VPYYARLTISAGIMTAGINVPYYACLTISAGNDFRN